MNAKAIEEMIAEESTQKEGKQGAKKDSGKSFWPGLATRSRSIAAVWFELRKDRCARA